MAFEQQIKTPMENADFVNGPIIEHRDEDEDEALSLSDLPTIDDIENVAFSAGKESPKSMDSLEEFNFCSSGRDSIFNDSELCTADEVFFQGQILPMMHRHSVSSEKSYNFQFRKSISNNSNKSISNVDTVDHCSLSGFTSSRSSSISSRYSLSSSLNSTTSSASLTAATVKTRVQKTRVLNQFQFSHPSPKPQSKPSSYNTKYTNLNSRSTMWSIFRVGLVTTREIDIQELKCRSINSNRNSNNNGDKRRKNSIFNKNGGLFGDCKCSAVGTVDSRIGVMKRSQSIKEEQQGGIKQSVSRHRTFEWLKQLSLDAIDDL